LIAYGRAGRDAAEKSVAKRMFLRAMELLTRGGFFIGYSRPAFGDRRRGATLDASCASNSHYQECTAFWTWATHWITQQR